MSVPGVLTMTIGVHKVWGRLASVVLLCTACDHVTSVQSSPEAGVPTGWTLIPAGTANLNAVSGVSDDAVWVVGDKGTIQFWDGKTLTAEKSGTTANLRGVWALDADQAFAVGDAGTILQRSNGVWTQVGMGVTRLVLTAVWADTTRVVAVGSNGTVVYGTTTYQLLASGVTENIFGVTGTPGGVVTAVGALGLVLELNGTTLTRTPIPSYSKLLSGAATGADATYFVGQNGTVFVNDATGPFNSATGCPASALRAVSVADTNAWIVGWDGTICKINGYTATVYPYTDARWFNGIYAASPTSLWVVGASGTLLHGLPRDPADSGAP
jgi:photosystem II stability/assembly factor-like uncharacterized protein